MLILKLAYNEELTFPHDLQELRESLKKKDITIGLVESIEGKTHIIKIICDKDSYSKKIEEIINLYVSNILYRIVIDYYSENSEKVRQLINQWMRSSESGVDGIIDFENAVADPANPQNLLAKYTNKDDGVHPYNGYQVMANAIDLNLFQ